MNLFNTLSLVSFIGVNYAVELTPATLARIAADSITPCTKTTNCHLKDPTADYTTATVRFGGAVNVDGCCQFTYFADHNDDNLNCLESNQNPSLSHFGIDVFCKDSATGIDITGIGADAGTTSLGSDGSTCTNNMLKFDRGFEKYEAEQSYTVCITWDGYTPSSPCNTKIGWIQQKAGGAWDFEEIEVPDLCEYEPVTPGTCVEQGAGLAIKSHVCVCVDGDCPIPSDGYYCNSISFVADRLRAPGVTDECGAGKTCCCNCPNCAQPE